MISSLIYLKWLTILNTIRLQGFRVLSKTFKSCKTIAEAELYPTYSKGFCLSNMSLQSDKMVNH